MPTAAGTASYGFINRSIRKIYVGFTGGAQSHEKDGLDNPVYGKSNGRKIKPAV
jgi:hypothetical protein